MHVEIRNVIIKPMSIVVSMEGIADYNSSKGIPVEIEHGSILGSCLESAGIKNMNNYIYLVEGKAVKPDLIIHKDLTVICTALTVGG